MNLISIVVAVYNAEKTLKRCVDSLLSQTYKNIEIILVNDCSEDSSYSICEEFEKGNNNIKVINNPQNLGVSATRNNGIKISTGKYICFVDSDDYVEHNYISRLYECAEKYNTLPICGFVYYDVINKRDPVKYLWSEGNGIVGLGKAFRLYDELYLTALWNKLFDNHIIKNHNLQFDVNLSMGEDLKFSIEYLNLLSCDSVYVLSEPLYNYFKINENSLMSKYFESSVLKHGTESLKLIKDLAIKYNPYAEHDFNIELEKLKKNQIYFIVRDEKYNNKEKLKKIRTFSPEYSTIEFYKEKIRSLKERIYHLIYN